MRLPYLLIAAVLSAGMAVTQHYALLYYWYWLYPWLDLVMHFTGGALIALLSIAWVPRARTALFVTLCVGLGWEMYEYLIGLVLIDTDFYSDVVLDLGMDFLGALLVCGMMHAWQRYGSLLIAERDVSPGPTSSLQ